jgi:putative transposase
MAPATHRAEMDLCRQAARTAGRGQGDPATRRAYGRREPNLGLHSHSWGPEERWVSSGAIDDCPDPEGEGYSADACAADVLADISAGALGRARRGGFLTTEVWTVRGLVTYYTLFVIELHSRRVRIVGSTPYPDEAFMLQTVRELTDATDGMLAEQRFLVCDRDRKWSTGVRHLLESSGVRVIRTPFRALNCNVHAKRFVRSIKEECLDRLIPLGERHFRRILAEFVVHYHRERNPQGLGNELIDGEDQQPSGRVRRHQRIGGLLSFYYRAA